MFYPSLGGENSRRPRESHQSSERHRRGYSLDIEDGVDGVHSSLVLGSLTDQTLLVGEGDERRGGERTLLVGNDLDIGTLVRRNAGVGGSFDQEDKMLAFLVSAMCRWCLPVGAEW